jgi:glycerophosphoryl diester phosphodiesterase
LKIFHVKWPVWKHVENSLRGIRKAARLGYDAIDLDILITKDGVIVVCHWDRPLRRDEFHDINRRIQVRAMVRELTWEQVKGLRAPGDYRILRIETALAACARVKIIAYLEPKDDPRFASDWPWLHIKAVAAKFGTKVLVRALPQNAAALPFARRAGGFRTRVIRRSN